MFTQLLVALIPVVTAGLVAWLAYRKYRREINDKKELIMCAVFGDLSNVFEHYFYASHELPRSFGNQRELKVHLKWGQFGKLHSISDIDKLGNLHPDEIRTILQLNLRIRNTDSMLEDFLKTATEVQRSDIDRVVERMQYCLLTAETLLKSISERRPNLNSTFEAMLDRFGRHKR